MAEAAVPEQAYSVQEFKVDVFAIESKFFYDLTEHALVKYELPDLFFEMYLYDNLARNVADEEEKKSKSNRNKAKLSTKNPYCKHIGDAILAISHVYRLSFKYRFDYLFVVMKRSVYMFKHCLYTIIQDIFHGKSSMIAMLNGFLVMCSLLIEIIVYMAFRGEFAVQLFVWRFFGDIYEVVFKDKFEQHGGWMLLKQVARPWWKNYERSKGSVEFGKPEHIYFIKKLDDACVIQDMIIHDRYAEVEDPSDIKYDPPSNRKNNSVMNSTALGSRGCYYFCLQRPNFEDKLIAWDDEFRQNLKLVLEAIEENNLTRGETFSGSEAFKAFAAECRSSRRSDSSNLATARIVHVPILSTHPPVHGDPVGFIRRDQVKSNYRKEIKNNSKNSEFISIWNAIFLSLQMDIRRAQK